MEVWSHANLKITRSSYMAFTTEHFVLVADVLRKNKASIEVIKSFADEFGKLNPRFKRPLFISVARHDK